jgi:hypothetical protein
MDVATNVATGKVIEDTNREYCERLVKLAKIAEGKPVKFEDTPYDQDRLRQLLNCDPKFREKAAKLCGLDPRSLRGGAKSAKQLIELFSGPCVEIEGNSYPVQTLLEVLLPDPKLQQRLAANTTYVPSKWLLEQEMLARGKWNPDTTEDIYKIVADNKLTGVCFSGGGIRSATFNLGVMQGLAQLGLLPWVDYLSSVSGGGYIHEFLAGWILRNGKMESVIKELIPQPEPGCWPRAPEPIQWLKRYASYLTPARGIFSADTWTAVAIWFRNTILNQIPLMAAFACGFFLVHILLPQPIEDWHPGFLYGPVFGIAGWWVSGIGLFVYAVASVCILWRNLLLQERRASEGQDEVKNLLTNTGVVRWVIMPWLACSLWMSYWVEMSPAYNALTFWWPIAVLCILILVVVEAVIFAGGAMRAYSALNEGTGWGRKGWALAGFAAGGIVATAVAVALGWLEIKGTQWGSVALAKWVDAFLGTKDAVNQSMSFSMSQAAGGVTESVSGSINVFKDGAAGKLVDAWRIRLVMLPGLLLSVPYVAIELTLGLLGRDYLNIRKEWLARLRAWSMLYGLLWAGVTSLVLLGPYVGCYIESKGTTWVWSSLIAFVASHGATIFAGWSGKADGKPTPNKFLGLKPMDLLALVAAPIAIVSMLLALSFAASLSVDSAAHLVHAIMSAPVNTSNIQFTLTHLAADVPTPWQFIFADVVCLLVALSVVLLLGWRVDINEFSMHMFYKNRLSRCYLGATVPGRRQADPFTGFDERGRVTGWSGNVQKRPPLLRDLLPVRYRNAASQRTTVYEESYDGPFPIFCATLNLTTGEDLATQERKGTCFAFTPLLSGYSVPWTDGKREKKVSYSGYVPTADYAYCEGGIHLDSAVAISGAALNPNQGYNSNPALAFLMTFFNVRLGWWISNTRKRDAWPATTGRCTPVFALRHLLKELFGKVGDDSTYVNLSDGGHFENMGLYELVRRRCKYIVVCDAEEDSEMTFGGMGGAITKCRADFGVEIDLDLRPLQIQDDTGYSKAHCVVGTIQYPPPHPPPGEENAKAPLATACECLGENNDDTYSGVIVYLKSSLVGDEPADLLAYQLKCATFPQDSTANQWFTESSFEAYRRLGHHIAMTAIKPALSPKKTQVSGAGDMPELFSRMYAIWYPRTPEMEKYLGDHLKQHEGILKELREREELIGLEERLNDPRRTADLPQRQIQRGAHEPITLPFVDWKAPTRPPASGFYATQFAISLLDFMYTVYTDLQLAFPSNRDSPHAGWWICLFRRWCRVSLVQDTWVSHLLVYSEEFRLFASRELGLP